MLAYPMPVAAFLSDEQLYFSAVRIIAPRSEDMLVFDWVEVAGLAKRCILVQNDKVTAVVINTCIDWNIMLEGG